MLYHNMLYDSQSSKLHPVSRPFSASTTTDVLRRFCSDDRDPQPHIVGLFINVMQSLSSRCVLRPWGCSSGSSLFVSSVINVVVRYIVPQVNPQKQYGVPLPKRASKTSTTAQFAYTYKVPLRDVDLNSRGCRELKRRKTEHGRSTWVSCLVLHERHWDTTVASTR